MRKYTNQEKNMKINTCPISVPHEEKTGRKTISFAQAIQTEQADTFEKETPHAQDCTHTNLTFVDVILNKISIFKHNLLFPKRTTLEERDGDIYKVIDAQDSPDCSPAIREKINEIYAHKTLLTIPENLTQIPDYKIEQTHDILGSNTRYWQSNLRESGKDWLLRKYSDTLTLRDKLEETYIKAKETNFITEKDENGKIIRKFNKVNDTIVMTEYDESTNRVTTTIFSNNGQQIEHQNIYYTYIFDTTTNKTIIDDHYGTYEIVDDEHITFTNGKLSTSVQKQKVDLKTNELTTTNYISNLSSHIAMNTTTTCVGTNKTAHITHNYRGNKHKIKIETSTLDAPERVVTETILIKNNEITNYHRQFFHNEELIEQEAYQA